MPYEIAALRPGKKEGQTIYKKFGHVDSLKDIYESEAAIKLVPENERYNIYFSIADVEIGTKRKIGVQRVIPFDIDGVEEGTAEEVLQVALDAIGFEFEECYSLASGNGVQFFIELEQPIAKQSYTPEYFKETMPYYLAWCAKIDSAIERNNLRGQCDPMMWKHTTIMRVGGTENRKKTKGVKRATYLNQTSVPQVVDIKKFGKIETQFEPEESTEYAARTPKAVDNEAILTQCEIIKYAKQKPEELTEPMWYHVLGVTARMNDPINVSKSISKNHPSYDPEETVTKVQQQLAKTTGPTLTTTLRTHDKFKALCGTCEHKDKCVTPLHLKSVDFIATENTGFREIKYRTDSNGVKVPIPGPVAYRDLAKYYKKKHNYFCDQDSDQIYIYDNDYFRILEGRYLEQHVDQKIKDPAPLTREVKEAIETLKREVVYSKQAEFDKLEGMVNLENGILNIKEGKLLEHSPKYKFPYKLSVAYDPKAKCPRFIQFLDEITLGDKEIQSLLLEFAAYAIANDKPWAQKALVLLGDGKNGKSVFSNLLAQLIGKDFVSALTMDDINDPTKALKLEGSILNIGQESGTSKYDNEAIKKAIAGEPLQVKRLYFNPHEIVVRSKMVFTCNSLPKTYDPSHGYFRRFIIIPFEAKSGVHFESDPHLFDKLLTERAGIFNLLIEHYKVLHKRGHFAETKRTKLAKDQYREESFPELQFWKDRIAEFPKESVEYNQHKLNNTEVYEAYVRWCENNGEKRKAANQFMKTLGQILPGFHDRKKKIDGRRFVQGIQFKGSVTGGGDLYTVGTPETYYPKGPK